jgi:CubicO group peptidase (beta-lactamase class C family)
MPNAVGTYRRLDPHFAPASRALLSAAAALALAFAPVFASAPAADPPGAASRTAPGTAPTVALSPAGRRAVELLELVRKGDRAAIREYMQSTFVPGRPEQIDQDLYELGRLFISSRGDIELLRVKDLGSNEAVAIYRNRMLQNGRALFVTVESASPHRILSWEKGAAASAVETVPVPRSDRAKIEAIDAYARRLEAADYFSGTILIARDGKPLMHRAYGLADRNHLIPNRTATRYNLASMVKMFTAISVAQLVEQKKLSYDDPVDKFVPGYLDADHGTRILVRHLLSHGSGLYGNVLVPLVAGEESLRLNSHADFLAAVPETEKQYRFEPGADHLYSNFGYMLLGRIIEVASGQTYYDYVREHIFLPAKMTSTAFPKLETVSPDQAVGYETFWGDSGTRLENNWLRIPARGLASGGAYSTTGDMLRFAEALRSGRLVRPETLAELTSPKPHSSDYGYGFVLTSLSSGEKAVGHAGDMAGVCTTFDMSGSGRDTMTIVVLANSTMGSCRPVKDKILELMGAAAPTTAAGR